MKKQHSSNRAILILESPWELDCNDSNRTSVTPFVEGIGKLAGDTEVYHANFYDKSSFIKALNCLCKRKFKNTTVYIAAHGYKKKIGNISISDLIWEVGLKSNECNITGLMLGSCFVGENSSTMEVFLEGNNLKWCVGYSSTSKWLEGTLIDCAILSGMSELDESDYSDKNEIIHHFANSIAAFSNSFHIGEDYNGNAVPLEDSLQFVMQPNGQGKRARSVSAEVFAVMKSLQI
ncbi:hypothetical protein [uncultured Oceanisphaera sp.]|uniref:hypothetical protein n=1 Tax=uncultured Oceanisphaera sp. TaxID=353858 RepID=UPI002604EC52|nr:hypothetical protein [uncultured Oceanisphaera sp.]